MVLGDRSLPRPRRRGKASSRRRSNHAVRGFDRSTAQDHSRASPDPGIARLRHPLLSQMDPGEHGPTGPIANLAGPLTITSNGKTVPWRRDDVEMYAIHVSVPGGAKSLELSLDFLLSGEEEGLTFGASSTPNVAVLKWNQVLLYPTGV